LIQIKDGRRAAKPTGGLQCHAGEVRGGRNYLPTPAKPASSGLCFV
jgi:hypothetical protein